MRYNSDISSISMRGGCLRVIRNKLSSVTIEKLFLFLALTFGLLYVFILPPFQSVDEQNHFFRVYQISENRILADNINSTAGGYLPESLYQFSNKYKTFIKNIFQKQTLNNLKKDFQIKLNPERRMYLAFPNTALYSPVCYITQLPGCLIAKTFQLPLAVIFYAGRLCNLLFYCIICFFAIKLTRFFKLPMMLAALTPMSLSLGAAYTSDVMLLGINFLWLALISNTLTCDEIQKKYIVALCALAFLLPLVKSYILLLPLIFLIPAKKFNKLSNYIVFIFAVLILAILSTALWYFCTKGLSINMGNEGANPALQVEFIKSNPLFYVWILTKTFFVKFFRLYITMVGVLGWQDTKLDFITYIIYPVLMYLAITIDNFKFTLENWQKLIIIFTAVFGTILTYTSLFLMWTPVGNSIVLGLNGKYFTPLILAFLLLLKKEDAKYDERKKLFIIIALILILLSSELSILQRFYDITPNLYYMI